MFLKIQQFYRDDTVVVEEPEVTEEVQTDKAAQNGKQFSQDDLNRLLAEERRRESIKAQKANEKLIKELQELKKTSQLTQEEKDRLETRIEDLKNEHLTNEQLKEKQRKKKEEEDKKAQQEIVQDRDRWRQLYSESTIERELVDAAAKGDAYNPDQILQILKPNTRLVDELDAEEKRTGRLIPRVRLAGKDKDGRTVVLDLNPTDAVKQMKEEMQDLYGNLFKSGAHGGVGGNNQSRVNNALGGPPNDPAAYREYRKQQQRQPARR